MARIEPGPDPYRVLGVVRGASPAQIKAAHRRLAKAYHPDGSSGDELRFLAVQEAYQLLSDPLRRREWDRAHAPGPVRAAGGRRQTGAPADHAGKGSRRNTSTARTPSGKGRRASASRRGSPRGDGEAAEDRRTGPVPWWQDFGQAEAADAATPAPGPDEDAAAEFDVFNRSSGAAWSAAARRHFRRGTDDLPSRGVWRYRGTQVVTGAEARKVAAEEEERRSRS